MAKRKNLSKKVRFEVFKRDSFKCQYCGRSAPDVVLEVDHIIPVSKGGDNDISNLITSCFDCNRGKRDKKLTDNQTIKLQKDELDKLNKRKEQLEMMSKWRIELLDLDNESVNSILEIVNKSINGNISFTEKGRLSLIKLIKKYGFEEILESSIIAFTNYPDTEIAFNKIQGIAYNRKRQIDNPNYKRIYYIRGIIRNRFHYVDDRIAIEILKEWDNKNLSFDLAEEIAKTEKNWTNWKNEMEYNLYCLND